MARKNGLKADSVGSIVFDTRTKAVMAESPQDNVKEKVGSVREVVPGKRNDEIILVLQYYDYNVERTIQAYLEDGANEALTQWHFPASGKTANKKKKKNKPKPANTQPPTPQSDQSQNSNAKSAPVVNHIGDPSLVHPLVNGGSDVHSNGESVKSVEKPDTSLPGPLSSSALSADQPLPPREPRPDRQRQHHHQSSHHSVSHSHPVHHGRERTVSEQSASSVSAASTKNKKPHAGLEKSTKDLQRQTIAIERYKRVLSEEVEKALKRIKVVFDEMRQSLTEREAVLHAEMESVKLEAMNTLTTRQSQAAELKLRVDRDSKLSDAELNELRADIKQFVSDRKIDEDLGKTTRFLYDSDHLQDEIKKFGEVAPVRCAYTTRRPSVSSHVSQSSEVAADEISPSPGATGSQNMSSSSQLSTAPSSALSHHQEEIIDVQSAQEMADIQRRLNDSLRLQGLPVKSPPSRQGRPPMTSGNQTRSGSGDHGRSGGQRGSGPRDPGRSGGQPSGPGGDDFKKSRNAKRRQKQRERQREDYSSNSNTGSTTTTTHNADHQPSADKPAPSVGRGPNDNRGHAQGRNFTSRGNSPRNNPGPSASGDASHQPIRNESSGPNRDRQAPRRDTRNRRQEDGPKISTNASPPAAEKETNSTPSRNSATVSVNGGGKSGMPVSEKVPTKRAEVIVNGDLHSN